MMALGSLWFLVLIAWVAQVGALLVIGTMRTVRRIKGTPAPARSHRKLIVWTVITTVFAWHVVVNMTYWLEFKAAFKEPHYTVRAAWLRNIVTVTLHDKTLGGVSPLTDRRDEQSEEQLRNSSRTYFDLYAMLLPYNVVFSTENDQPKEIPRDESR